MFTQERSVSRKGKQLELVIDGLSAWHGQARALKNVTFRVSAGEVVGVLGRNGAGKTTLLRAIARLHSPTTGTVKLGEHHLDELTATAVARLGLSLVREGAVLPLTLSVEENIRMGARLCKSRKLPSRSLDEVYETFPLLKALRNRKSGVLSGGQRQTLALAVAYASRPTLLLLDEPSTGLSPLTARSVFGTIAQLAAASEVTVLVVEQSPAWLEGLATRNYLLELGEIAAEGTIGELLDSSAGSVPIGQPTRQKEE